MDSEPNQSPSDTESSRSEVTHSLEWETLPFRLGYAPTAEMNQLDRDAIAVAVSGEAEASKQLQIAYYDAGITHIESLPADQYAQAQVGHLIKVASIKSESGLYEAAIEDLQDVLAVTTWGRLDHDYSPIILAEIARLQRMVESETSAEELSASQIIERCQDILAEEMADEAGRDEWLGLDVDDLVGGLIGLLYSQGEEDPEAILRERGILEDE